MVQDLVLPTTLQPPVNLLALDQGQVRSLVSELGWPSYRAAQILQWLYHHRITDIDQMTDLSILNRTQLKAMAAIPRAAKVRRIDGEDGTQKFLLLLQDGLEVECVLIPEGSRRTLCVSTQVGCTLDCSFCLTGRMGLKRNLKAYEIMDQVLTAQSHLEGDRRISSVVLMGMGEPLANMEPVVETIVRLTDSTWGLGFSPRRITLSTAGMAPRLQDVATLGINLAVSLNATTHQQRNRLMPAVNQLYPLPELLKACREYPLAPHSRLTFEYVLLAGINDSAEDAKRLQKLVRGIRCKINLIPFNEFPESHYRRPSDETIHHFQSVLRKGGLDVFIRKSRGRDVLGACGQLGNLEG